jgi:hypothetical protein
MIDGLWTIAVERADQAGKELAKVRCFVYFYSHIMSIVQALLARPAGSPPVTLVGYSMGARVIFSCLKHLAHPLRCDDSSIVPSPEQEVCLEGEEESSDDDGESFFDNEQATSDVSEPAVTVESKVRSRFHSLFKRRDGLSTKDEAKVIEDTCLNRSDVLGIVQDVVLLGAPVSLTVVSLYLRT